MSKLWPQWKRTRQEGRRHWPLPPRYPSRQLFEDCPSVSGLQTATESKRTFAIARLGPLARTRLAALVCASSLLVRFGRGALLLFLALRGFIGCSNDNERAKGQ